MLWTTVVESYGIHWFRRDLRVAGNPALEWSWKEHKGRVLGVFFFDSKFLSRPDFSHNRFAFFLETMKLLKEELILRGADLLVLDKLPAQGFEYLFSELKKRNKSLPATVSWNRDYEPFARDRDQKVAKLLKENYGLSTNTERDHLIIEPHEILKEDGGFYQIYSAFARKWLQKFSSSEIQGRIKAQSKGIKYLDSKPGEKIFALSWTELFGNTQCPADQLERYIRENSAHVTIPIPKAGAQEALLRLKMFLKSSVESYTDQRDFPDIDGTSKLAMFQKNGSFVSTQILCELGLSGADFKSKEGKTVFLKEIVWREFYYHILYHLPRVENSAFMEKYDSIEWGNNESWFKAWKEGMTGYPIVDAGMRQLNQSGWMHNRVRMIVASFLTKDLHISWQWGERYFMEKLLDGDLAPNNGGWQWAASTGCDPQPYFRIFNPKLQSEKFDPDGNYIRRFVPELSKLSAKEIHEPHLSGNSVSYPQPIVDHRAQKEGALSLYKKD